MNKQDEPYDGIAGFSQGIFITQLLYKVVQYCGKTLDIKHRMPYFVIDFSAARWDHITLQFSENKFISSEVFPPGVDSIHYKSQSDHLYRWLWQEKNFERSLVIHFEGGHRPVKILTREKLD
jgi:hypothetical protein